MKIIDMHAHIFMHKGVETEKRMILESSQLYGVDKTFVSALNGFFPSIEQIDDMNRVVADFARENADLICGYVYFSPEKNNALDVIRRGIEMYGMKGAKGWVSERFDSPLMDPIAELMEEYNLPLLLHAFKKTGGPSANESTAVHIRSLAKRHPDLKIIMAHVGGNCYHGAPIIADCKNVYVDISGSPARSGEVEYTVNTLGEDRVLFGSDLTGCSFAMAYGKVIDARIATSVKEKILSLNTERLFDPSYRIGE